MSLYIPPLGSLWEDFGSHIWARHGSPPPPQPESKPPLGVLSSLPGIPVDVVGFDNPVAAPPVPTPEPVVPPIVPAPDPEIQPVAPVAVDAVIAPDVPPAPVVESAVVPDPPPAPPVAIEEPSNAVPSGTDPVASASVDAPTG